MRYGFVKIMFCAAIMPPCAAALAQKPAADELLPARNNVSRLAPAKPAARLDASGSCSKDSDSCSAAAVPATAAKPAFQSAAAPKPAKTAGPQSPRQPEPPPAQDGGKTGKLKTAAVVVAAAVIIAFALSGKIKAG